jgi:5-methylthioadenosine/S-adenosylhomocysteine deaminase
VSTNNNDILIVRNTRVLNADGSSPVLADVVVQGAKIIDVGPGAGDTYGERTGVKVLDGTDRLVVPGFVNAHYHSHDVLAKGTMEEEILEWWALLALPPSFPPRTVEEVRVRTLLGALECLRGGITTVQDMLTFTPFDPEQLEAAADAYREIGMRAVIGPQYADKAGIETRPFWADEIPLEHRDKAKSFAEPNPNFDILDYLETEYFSAGNDGGLVTWVLAPTAPEACSDELILKTVGLSEKYDLPIFTHIYESKSMAVQARQHYKDFDGSLINWLKKLGMTGPRVNLAHSVWLLEHELQTLAETDTRVVFNMLSNLKLKSGIPPISRVQELGIGYSLGCDNPSCSDSQNMFQAMKLTATLNAVSDYAPLPNQAAQVFRAATVGGAEAIGREGDIGRIEPGYRADFSLLDLTDPSWLPLNNAVRQLVYAESGRGVKTVVINGDVVIDDGRSTKIDEQRLRDELLEIMPRFLGDFRAAQSRVEEIRPYLNEAHRRVWGEDVGCHRIFGAPPTV